MILYNGKVARVRIYNACFSVIITSIHCVFIFVLSSIYCYHGMECQNYPRDDESS